MKHQLFGSLFFKFHFLCRSSFLFRHISYFYLHYSVLILSLLHYPQTHWNSKFRNTLDPKLQSYIKSIDLNLAFQLVYSNLSNSVFIYRHLNHFDLPKSMIYFHSPMLIFKSWSNELWIFFYWLLFTLIFELFLSLPNWTLAHFIYSLSNRKYSSKFWCIFSI